MAGAGIGLSEHALESEGVAEVFPVTTVAAEALRTRKTITYRFSISSSGRLWPFLNREILNVGTLRLRFRSIDHDQIHPKSERIIRQLIVLHALTR